MPVNPNPREILRDPALSEILASQFRSKGPFYRDQNFEKDLGGDELDLIETIMELEEAKRLSIPDEGFMKHSPAVGRSILHPFRKRQPDHFLMKQPNIGEFEDYIASLPGALAAQSQPAGGPPSSGLHQSPDPQQKQMPKAACSKTMKKLRPKNKKQATDLMAAYVRILANKAAKNQKSASDNPLQRLAPAIQKHGDFFKALNEAYSDKSAAYRVKIAKGLVKGLETKLANMALQTAPQMGPQTMEIPSPNGARASALMNRLTGGVQQMQQASQPQAAPEGIQ